MRLEYKSNETIELKADLKTMSASLEFKADRPMIEAIMDRLDDTCSLEMISQLQDQVNQKAQEEDMKTAKEILKQLQENQSDTLNDLGRKVKYMEIDYEKFQT